jgi:hypothetical protein
MAFCEPPCFTHQRCMHRSSADDLFRESVRPLHPNPTLSDVTTITYTTPVVHVNNIMYNRYAEAARVKLL